MNLEERRGRLKESLKYNSVKDEDEKEDCNIRI